MSRTFDLIAPECGKNLEVGVEADLTPQFDKNVDTTDIEIIKNGIRKIVRELGSGDDYPNAGDKIKISYKAYKGDEICEEYFFEANESLEYEVCRGKVLRGFELAILTMRVGESAEIYLKPEYAYGKAGAPPEVPPDSCVTFVVKLLDLKCPDLSEANDRSLLKKTIVKGKGWRVPNDGCMMKIHMKGWYTGADRQDVVLDDREVYFPYGEGTSKDHKVPRFIEKYIHHWKRKEKARLFLKSQHAYGKRGNPQLGVPPDTDLTYIVELKDFEKEKDIWEMNNAEKLDACEKLREKGKFYYMQNDMNLANKFYTRIIEIVGNDLCMDGEDEKKRQDILHIGYLNLAQVSINKKNFRLAKDACDKAIAMEGKENNVKALYRRGVASFNLQEWASAIADFEKVLQLEPSNGAAKTKLADSQRRAKETAGQEKQLAEKMISGFGKGRDDRLLYKSGMNDIDEWNNRMAQGMMTLEEEQAAFTDLTEDKGGNNHGLNH